MGTLLDQLYRAIEVFLPLVCSDLAFFYSCCCAAHRCTRHLCGAGWSRVLQYEIVDCPDVQLFATLDTLHQLRGLGPVVLWPSNKVCSDCIDLAAEVGVKQRLDSFR